MPFLTKKGKNYTCNDTQFDTIFPLCDKKSAHTAVGQIELSDGTLGTGTIYDLAEKSKKLVAKGITAKHVLFDDKDNPLFGDFFQARIGINGNTTYACKYNIKKIFTNSADPNKDIALFEAEAQPNSKDKKALLKTTIPSFIKNKSSSKNAQIYHHPMGVEEQRKNEGTITNGTAHLITTLPGSSGASLLNKRKQIIGIHTQHGAKKNNEVEYIGSNLPSITGEKFVISTENEYDSIKASDLLNFDVEHKK